MIRSNDTDAGTHPIADRVLKVDVEVMIMSTRSFRGNVSRYHQFRSDSVAAAKHFTDATVDCVFVDGLHTFSGVAADIAAWLPKIRRPGGRSWSLYSYDLYSYGLFSCGLYSYGHRCVAA